MIEVTEVENDYDSNAIYDSEYDAELEDYDDEINDDLIDGDEEYYVPKDIN